MNWLRTIRRLWSERRHEVQIEVTRSGVLLRHSYGGRRPEGTESWAWLDVQGIVGFKRDLITTDLICWLIQLRDGRAYELHEEARGWDSLTAAAPESLPGLSKTWWSDVALPAFQLSETVVYERVR